MYFNLETGETFSSIDNHDLEPRFACWKDSEWFYISYNGALTSVRMDDNNLLHFVKMFEEAYSTTEEVCLEHEYSIIALEKELYGIRALCFIEQRLSTTFYIKSSIIPSLIIYLKSI